MRVLLDNSTLTAAFRALNLVKNTNQALFDIDLASLRLLVDAIALSKKIFVLDDYKEQYIEERKSWMVHPDIEFVQIDPKLESRFRKNAIAHVRNWQLTSKLATDYADIFEDLDILFRNAWRHSESFLVLRAFGEDEKYGSSIVEGYLDYLRKNRDLKKLLWKFRGKSFDKKTSQIAQSISWAAIRTVYYRQAAKLYGAEYFPHPLRNAFNLKCILFDNHPNSRKEKLHSKEFMFPEVKDAGEQHMKRLKMQLQWDTYPSAVNRFFRSFWAECTKSEENEFGISTHDVDVPPFLGYVVNRISSPDQVPMVLENAFKLRDNAGCRNLRNILFDVFTEEDMGVRDGKLRRLLQEFTEVKNRMQSYLGYHREKVSLSAKLVSYSMTIPRCLLKPLYPFKPHMAFIRDVIQELASISTFGKVHDILWNARG